MELIKLKRNFMFNDIFNQSKNVSKLETFISIYFDIPYDKVHNNLKLVPRDLPKDKRNEAWKEVDLLLTLENELLRINIEINDSINQKIVNRNIIYISKITSMNYEIGDKKYERLWTSRQINFNIKGNNSNKLINEFIFKEKETNEILSDIVEIDVINMEMINKLCYNDLNEKERLVYNFCKMLEAGDEESFKEVSKYIMNKDDSKDLLNQVKEKSSSMEYVYMESAYSSE